mmetsp:Transcript_11502/g.28329  ORF Transcript_11502/g.28329 Transcript_11502/m.28329 type:complete len:84 (+) Transcript_11502:414-665(+)
MFTPVGRDAAYPKVQRPVPTAPSPAEHAATGPNAFKNLEVTNADMVKLTNANDVNAKPTAWVSKPNRFWRRDGKNAKNVLSAA